MKKTNKSKPVCTGYAAPRPTTEDIFPHLKRNFIGLLVLMGIWYVAMSSGIEFVVDVALWGSVVFILFILGLAAVNVLSDFRETVRIWSYINGNNFVQKCRCIVGAVLDRVLTCEDENTLKNRRTNTILLVLCGILIGFLVHLVFLYAMCIIVGNGLFGVPAWLWGSIIVSQLVATPALFLHLAIPQLLDDMALLEEDLGMHLL